MSSTIARLLWRAADGRTGELPVAAAGLTIGRASDCGLAVDSVQVSRVHCRIVGTDAGWAIEDAGSSNGTFVNGYQLRARRPLTSGDRIQLGLPPVQLEAEFVTEIVALVAPPDPRPTADELAAEVARLRAATAQLHQLLGEAQEREAAASRGAAAAAADVERAETELVDARDRLSEARTAIAELEDALATARGQLAARDAAERTELIAARDELETRLRELRKVQGERDQLIAVRGADRTRAEAAEANLERAVAQVSELEAEVEQLRRLVESRPAS